MFFSYNGFNHPPGTVNAMFHFDAVLNEGEQIVAYKARVDITGKLISNAGDSDAAQADLTSQIQAIQQAYVNGGDALLVLSNGQPSANSILNAQTLGGTRITRAPSFPDGGAAQYATQRDFAIAIEAELPTLDGSTALWSFEESLSFTGTGGPATDVVDVVQGNPVPQTLRQKTAMKAVQSGRAVGYLGYAIPMYQTPIWPQWEQQQERVTEQLSPKRTGSGANTKYKLFPTVWRYTFKSPVPLVGLPNVWPIG